MSPPREPGTPRDPRRHRQNVLVLSLQVVLGVVVALAAASVALRGDVAHELAVVMVSILAAAPVARLLWLIARWTSKGDLRYAALAGALVGIIGAAAVIGLA